MREGKALAVRVGNNLFVRPPSLEWEDRKRHSDFMAECITLFVTIAEGHLTISYSTVEGAREYTYPTHREWLVEWELTEKCCDAND